MECEGERTWVVLVRVWVELGDGALYASWSCVRCTISHHPHTNQVDFQPHRVWRKEPNSKCLWISTLTSCMAENEAVFCGPATKSRFSNGWTRISMRKGSTEWNGVECKRIGKEWNRENRKGAGEQSPAVTSFSALKEVGGTLWISFVWKALKRSQSGTPTPSCASFDV